MVSKKEQRLETLKKISKLSRDEVECKSRCICDKLLKNEHFLCAKTIMAYMAYGNEVLLDSMIEWAIEAGKMVYVPRVCDDSGKMEAIRVYSLDKCTEKDKFDIRVPNAPATLLRTNNDINILPGLAFDKTGARLGKGGGYYDKFISKLDYKTYLLGVCFDVQMVDKVVCQEHDMAVSSLITETKNILISE